MAQRLRWWKSNLFIFFNWSFAGPASWTTIKLDNRGRLNDNCH